MPDSMIVKGAHAAFEVFMMAPVRHFEPAITNMYESLATIPGQGAAYVLRAIAMSRPGDKMRLPLMLKAVVAELFAHYRRVGIQVMHETDIVWSDEFGYGLGETAEVFLFDHRSHGKWPNQHRLNGTVQHEHKGRFARTYHSLSHVPFTAVSFTGVPISAERAWLTVGKKPGLIKIALGASGDENAIFSTLSELEAELMSGRWDNKDFVVQQRVGATDGSVNYLATDEGVYFLFATRQQNNGQHGTSHVGNFYVPTFDRYCRNMMDSMALQAWRSGVRGCFGFDLRLEDDWRKFWVVECNARVTAPAYSWFLAQKTMSPWWCTMNFKGFGGTTIADVVPPELEYSSSAHEGVVCHNPGPIAVKPEEADAACSVTILASDEARGRQILAQLSSHLGVAA